MRSVSLLLLVFPCQVAAQSGANYTHTEFNTSDCSGPVGGSWTEKYLGGACYEYVDHNCGSDVNCSRSYSLHCGPGDRMIGFDYRESNCDGEVSSPGWASKWEGNWSKIKGAACVKWTYPAFLHTKAGEPSFSKSAQPLDELDYPACKRQLSAEKTMYTTLSCSNDAPIASYKHVQGNCFVYVNVRGDLFPLPEGYSFTMKCEGPNVHMIEYLSSRNCTGSPEPYAHVTNWQSFTTSGMCVVWSEIDSSRSEKYNFSERVYAPLKPSDYPQSCMPAQADTANGQAPAILLARAVAGIGALLFDAA